MLTCKQDVLNPFSSNMSDYNRFSKPRFQSPADWKTDFFVQTRDCNEIESKKQFFCFEKGSLAPKSFQLLQFFPHFWPNLAKLSFFSLSEQIQTHGVVTIIQQIATYLKPIYAQEFQILQSCILNIYWGSFTKATLSSTFSLAAKGWQQFIALVTKGLISRIVKEF